jgi:hypothetical protein
MKQGVFKQNGVHLQEHEYATVKLLLKKGFDVELIPPSRIKNLRMPDIMLQGVQWEMKSPNGGGKNTIRHTIQNAGHQASNVIIDLRRCPIQEEKVIREIKYYFNISRRVCRMIVITHDEELLDI